MTIHPKPSELDKLRERLFVAAYGCWYAGSKPYDWDDEAERGVADQAARALLAMREGVKQESATVCSACASWVGVSEVNCSHCGTARIDPTTAPPTKEPVVIRSQEEADAYFGKGMCTFPKPVSDAVWKLIPDPTTNLPGSEDEHGEMVDEVLGE